MVRREILRRRYTFRSWNTPIWASILAGAANQAIGRSLEEGGHLQALSPRQSAMPKRTKAQKDHAAKERDRYRILKNGLLRGIAMMHGERDPVCMMPTGKMVKSIADVLNGKPPSIPIICGSPDAREIDHKHFSRVRQRQMNSVQRLEYFAIDLVKWMGGDDSRELRIACRSCNAKHQPKRRR